jgi:hypothetical protein
VYALGLSAESLNKADDPLGQLFKKLVPAARTMPNKKNFREKYLQKLFDSHLSYVKNIISDRKISLIMNESPDIIGRKTVNTLISFNYALKNKKCVLLTDCSATESVNAGKIKQIEKMQT